MSETQTENTNVTPSVSKPPQAKFGGFMSNWRFRAGLIVTAVATVSIGLFTLVFFWGHIIAGFGMKSWSSHADASPIECMIKDTNSDGYVSCSAMLRGEVVPLECGASIFNIGCRVSYGAAAPPVRQAIPTDSRGRS